MALSISSNKATKAVSISTLHDATGEKFRWILEIEQDALHVAHLSEFTLHLLAECQISPSVADALLGLETLVREIEKRNGVEQP